MSMMIHPAATTTTSNNSSIHNIDNASTINLMLENLWNKMIDSTNGNLKILIMMMIVIVIEVIIIEKQHMKF